MSLMPQPISELTDRMREIFGLVVEACLERGVRSGGDVARMALFLAADDSQMITGQDFIVDGGWTAR